MVQHSEYNVPMDDSAPDHDVEPSIVYWNAKELKSFDELSSPERLIEAGWRVLDSAELDKAFTGATAARVSSAAGLTTGSFFHHFPNAEAFAKAMATDLAKSLSQTDLENVSSVASREANSALVDLSQLVRSFMESLWIEYMNDPIQLARLRCQMRLWSHYPAALGDDPDSPTIADLLREGYLRSERISEEMWQPAFEQSGLEIAEPFDVHLLTVVASALFEGLKIRAAIDPDSVPPYALGDSLVALVNGVMRPAGIHMELSDDGFEVKGQTEPRSPQARSGAQRRYETRQRIVAACAGMFSDGWENVPATDVATTAGVSTQTITNLFGSVRAIAAATFARQAQRMYRNALGRSTEDPWNGLRESLTDLTVRARIDPEVARALLDERVRSAIKRGPSLGDMDVRLEVPISGAFGLWLGRLGMAGGESIPLASALANFILSMAITTEDSAESVADLAMKLLPDEIINNRSGRRLTP